MDGLQSSKGDAVPDRSAVMWNGDRSRPHTHTSLYVGGKMDTVMVQQGVAPFLQQTV